MSNPSSPKACSTSFASPSNDSMSSVDGNCSHLLKISPRRCRWSRRVFSLAAAVSMLAASLTATQAQTLAPSWYPQSPSASPSARYIHAITYDGAHNQVVLFGGFGGGTDLNDTWLWNGTAWAQANPVHIPPARSAHAMVYDETHGQLMLFGGLASVSTRLGDTWLWNGSDWTQLNPVNSPSPRDGAVMVYDAATSQVILFGGVDNNGVNVNDTWVWTGTNWNQRTPTNSPSPRADYSMVYDAATSQVILFGGKSSVGYLNDTWIWNGTNWSQQAPANSPSARYAQGMAYDAALGQVVMFGGYNGSFLNDTWVYDGTNWTQDVTTASPAGRSAPNAMTYDVAHSQVILFGGLGSAQTNDTWQWGLPGNFGNVNVCPSGQAAPAPCSNTLALTFNLTTTTSFGPTRVVAQGLPGFDFQEGLGSTCTGTVSLGSCTVNVIFAPVAPGLRTGSVQLVDTAGNVLTNTLVYGVGQGAATVFTPGTQTTVNASANYPLSQPRGVAVDAAGDLFIADTGNHRVVKIASSGNVSTVGSGLNYPQGMAVDGAGNLFIADNNLNQVIEVPVGCTTAACQIAVGVGLRSQLGVAVDGAGNVFIGDFNDHQVVKVPRGCSSSACQTLVYGGPGSGSNPVGLAVDATGNLFIADFGLALVVEVPPGCASGSCQIKVGQGWAQPEAVAVDAAGDVFVADLANHNVVEVPRGCTSSSCQTIVLSGASPLGVAVDPEGNIFVPDLITNQVVRVNRSQPPSLSFAATNVGGTSSDSPKSITLKNIGNQSLNGVAPGLIVNGPGFVQTAGPGSPVDCSATFALLPGAACDLSVAFKPQLAGNPLTGTAVFTDNALNATSVTQSVTLSGVGVASTYGLTVSEIGIGTGTVTDNLGQISCSEANGQTTGSCAGNYAGGTLVTLSATASGTSKFQGWGGVCASAGTSSTCSVSVTMAGNATASFVNQNFGNINVCPLGQNSPEPCSNSLALTFNLASTTTVGAIQIVTQGATGLDFSLASGATCTGTVVGGTSCSVNVTFAPLAPGLRMGAVELFDNNANLLATTPIYGIGQEPAIAFGPGTQTTIPTAGLSGSLQGAAIDAAGNIYIADSVNNRVVKLTSAGIQTAVPVIGLNGPAGLAVDGAGNLFIANVLSSQVVEVTPAGLQSTVNTPGFTLNRPNAVAMDGAGNLFIADTANGRVLKIPTGGGNPTTIGTGLTTPVAIALDGAGGLLIADSGTHQVLRVINATQTQINTTLTNPSGLAVDAAGDVYIADGSHNTVVEVTPGGFQMTLSSTPGAGQPYALALNAAGDVLIASSNISSNPLVKITRSQPPSLSFALTNLGSASTDSPQPITIQNIGNQPLTGSLTLSLGAGFTQNAVSDCSTAFPLVPSATCSESFSFAPPTATFFAGSAILIDNALNSAPLAVQTITFSGTGAIAGQAGTVAVPNVVGQDQTAAATPLAGVGLVLGTVTSASSSTVASGSVISQNPVAGTQVTVGSAVKLLVSSGMAQPPSPNPLLFENNYFLTGDYVSAGVTLRGTGSGGMATGSVVIPNYTQSATQGVPDGADIVDAFLYWETVENTPSPSSTNGTFNHYPIVGQQIGSDLPNFTDGAFTGTIRAYRANVNVFLPAGANGVRFGSGTFPVSLPDSGGTGFPLTEGASLVIVYRVLSPNFPLKSVVIYDGSAHPTSSTVQVVKGFYDAVGGANGTGKSTNIFASAGAWNNRVDTAVALGQSDQFKDTLNSPGAYAAVILSTPVNNSDNDGLLDAWKTGPTAGDFHAGQPGYYDVKSGSWVGLPGAKHGQKDLFVQLDYMCGAVLADGSCDPAKENLFPAPDTQGNDPLAMVKEAFADSGVYLHLQIGNAVPESTCTDDLTTNPAQLCQFPNQPGVVGWKNSLQFSKLFPRNLLACLTGGDCTTRFPYGQKDSYHYVLFGHSLAVSAWNSRFGSLTSINVINGVTTIGTVERSAFNACPRRITLSGVLGNPSLNGVYNTTSCADAKTIVFATPGVPDWSYPNGTLPEPVIGLTSGNISSISGYSDLGGADSAVTLGLWLTAPNQDMSKRANVVGGTLFHEIGHTLGLSHGGLYYDTPGSYVPTFEGNCKPNYQSVMNYLFQLDLVGPNQAIALSNQTLATLNETTAGSTTQLTDVAGNPATFATSAWYVPNISGSPVSSATRHCDGTPLPPNSVANYYRVDAPIAPITPAWVDGQDLNFIGKLLTQERGFNDVANMDLRQIGATGGEFASLAKLLSFGSSVAPLNIGVGGNVVLGSGGTIALGSGGTVTLGSGGNVTLGSGGTITMGSGGNVTLGSGGNVTLGSGGTVTPGSSGTVTLGSGGNVTLSSGGTITLGSGGTVTLGSGGTITLGSGGTIALGSGGMVTVPAGGTYTINGSGGTVTLGSGGNVTLGSGGNVTLGSGGTIALGSGGNVTLGSGGNVTLGSGGTIALGSGGNVTLGSGGNVTLGSGGTIALGSGGTVTLGSGGNVTLGSGGTVTLGSGGNVALGSGGNVTLGSGGTATLGAGGTVTLGSGGNVTLGSGGNVTLGSGGTIALGSGGTVTLGSGGTVTLGSGGTISSSSGGTVTVPAGGGTYTIGAGGGTITLGSGGNVTLGSGGTIALGSGGTITLGSGGTVTLGSGGNVILGSGGVVTLGTSGSVNLGTGSTTALGTVNNVAPGSGGPLTNELTYETANSIVRPPTSPTQTSTPGGVRITWKAPAFGVVQTYTIYRSSNGAIPNVIGSVSGVNGFPPATEFTDTNPDVTAQTVVYTVSTILVPDAIGASRQSPPSPPAVLKSDQSISLGPLPSSVTLENPPTITATALSGGVPNGLQVLFSAAGSCSVGSQSIVNKVSSATISLNATGSCTVTASQPGSNTFNVANAVSGTFMVLPTGSGTLSQTITFALLQNAQYGSSFSLSASSSANIPVSFTASGPCTTSGSISGVGVCAITAFSPGDLTHSPASLTQKFTIYPAVLKVAADNLTSIYGQPLPPLTYTYSGFVGSDTAAVVSGVPVLSTSATGTSNSGTYPVTVSTGTLATANYSFLYVSGALALQPANQAALILNTSSPLIFSQTEILIASGGTTGGAVTYHVISGACVLSGARLTASSGTGICQVTATMAGNINYSPVTSTPASTVALAPASQIITFTTNPPTSANYTTSFTVAATGGASGNAVIFSNAGPCTNSGATYTMTNSTGACVVIANQAANANYAAAPQATKSVVATGPLLTVSPSNLDFGTLYLGSIKIQNITVKNIGTAPAIITDPLLSIVKGGDSKEFLAINFCPTRLAAGASCTITVAFIAGPYYTLQTAILQITDNAPGSPQPVTMSAQVIFPVANLNPTSLNFGTVRHATTNTLNVTLSNGGATPLLLTGSGISILGTNATVFSQTNNCGSALAPGARCIVTVRFAPLTSGTFSASLTVVDNAQAGLGTQTIALSGRGN